MSADDSWKQFSENRPSLALERLKEHPPPGLVDIRNKLFIGYDGGIFRVSDIDGVSNGNERENPNDNSCSKFPFFLVVWVRLLFSLLS